MRNASIRTKVTIWFTVSIIIVVALTYLSIITISSKVIERTIQDNLIESVENNMDEIEFHPEIIDDELDNDADYYMSYNGGFMEIDDDFLSAVNGVSSAVYDSEKNLIFGKNPIAEYAADLNFLDGKIRKIKTDEGSYFVFDRKKQSKDLNDIWIRGVVSKEQGTKEVSQISLISLIVMVIIMLIVIIGGNNMAGRMLAPIGTITKAASRISKGNDLKDRIVLETGEDEVHQLADSFNQMMGRLDDSFEKEKQFTSDVSHELRTPIAVIQAHSEYALENDLDCDGYVETLQVINRQSNKMMKMVNNILLSVRLGREHEIYEKTKTDLSNLLESVCDDMKLIGEKGITLDSKIDQDICVNGNQELLTRMVVNLINNAYKYGKASGNIKVALTADECFAALSVEDDGIGIAPEHVKKIFDRFYQVDASRTDKGSGLGLSIVRDIALYHNGEVTVTSQLGEGSKFLIKIPIL